MRGDSAAKELRGQELHVSQSTLPGSALCLRQVGWLCHFRTGAGRRARKISLGKESPGWTSGL